MIMTAGLTVSKMDKGQRSEGSGHNELEYNSLKMQHSTVCSSQFNSTSLIQATWPYKNMRDRWTDRKQQTGTTAQHKNIL